jgi:hypothetical protein
MAAQTYVSSDGLVRRALQTDGIVCIASGAVFALGAGALTPFLGIDSEALTLGFGLFLLVYGLILFTLANRVPLDPRLPVTIIPPHRRPAHPDHRRQMDRADPGRRGGRAGHLAVHRPAPDALNTSSQGFAGAPLNVVNVQLPEIWKPPKRLQQPSGVSKSGQPSVLNRRRRLCIHVGSLLYVADGRPLAAMPPSPG